MFFASLSVGTTSDTKGFITPVSLKGSTVALGTFSLARHNASRDKRRSFSMPLNFWISVAIACLFTGIWSLAARAFSIEQGDFPAFYTGAQVALSGKFGSLHDVKLQAALQKQATQG